MICWGIDPGYGRLGFGVIQFTHGKFLYSAHGVLETPGDLGSAERLLLLEKLLKAKIKLHPPDVCMVEEVFFRKNLTTGVQLLQARGVILLTMAREGIPIFETTPTALKKMLTGYGAADKQQLQQMIKALLGLREIPQPDDASDALALAIGAALRVRGENYKTAQPVRRRKT